MTTYVNAIQTDGRHFQNAGISMGAERKPSIEDHSTIRVTTRTLAVRARQALRWAGICLLTEAAVFTILAAMGLVTGMSAGHHFFWALGVGFFLATPICILVAVVIAEVLEGASSDPVQRDSHGLS